MIAFVERVDGWPLILVIFASGLIDVFVGRVAGHLCVIFVERRRAVLLGI